MHFQAIRTLAEMESLATEWNDLVENSASDVPFLRYEYLHAWFKTLGGEEWPTGELYTVTGRDDQGTLVGIAPLFFTINRDGDPALMLLGSIEISDYLDLIARPADLQAFVAGLFDHLDSSQAPAWRSLDWWNFLDSSKTPEAIRSAAQQKGWSYNLEPLQHCPYIPLPGDWEQYLSEQVDKKQRHEIRRKIRRAESNELPVRWYFVEDESTLEAEIEAFLQLMAYDSQKAQFLTEPMRAQMRLGAWAAWKAGYLQLAFLEVGGEKAAGYINFDYKDHIWVYNSGLNFDYSALSPGWVLLGYLLQWANENGRKIFDFLRGDEDYKYKFGGIDRRVHRVVVKRN